MRAEYGASYARLYREHWWWRAREAILVAEIDRLGLPAGARILDIGCGDALSFPALSAFGEVFGIEPDASLLDPDGPHRGRIATAPLGDPSHDRYRDSFDLITALDVLEHIDDDRAAVAAMAGMLRPGGVLVVTVPAFAILWDFHDVINEHRRRYNAARLRLLLDIPGLGPARLRYLFRSLFIPKLTVALLNAGRRRKVAQHAIPPAPINAAMRRLCLWEDRLLRHVPIPLGTSLLAVARRTDRDAGATLRRARQLEISP